MFGGNDVVTRLQEGMSEKFNDLVRAIAKHHVIDAQTKFLGDTDTQMIAAAIRIKMRFQQGLLHRLDRQRRGPKRVFVGGKLDDLTRFQPKFPSHIFNRFPRDVTDKVIEPLVRFFKNLVHEG